jgi:MSHA biogenesis protein MshO
MKLFSLRNRPLRNAGVTLIELAITIALVGILGALIVQFVAPVRSYIDTSRRAALTDTADTALRRIGRDLRLALPNSVRVNDPNNTFVEFLLVRTGGRYRYEPGASGTDCGGTTADDVLTFGAPDTCFTSIGSVPNSAEVKTSDFVVVYNLPPGTDKADVYQDTALGATPCGTTCNKAKITTQPLAAGTGGHRIDFTGGNTFTYESPGRRFFIVEGAVSYGCAGGVLTRYSGYTNTTPETQPAPPSGASTAVIATGVTSCSFTYDTSVSAQGAGLVTMRLQLGAQISGGGTETVTLYHAVHVNNVP